MKKIEINKGKLTLKDEVIGFLERDVTPFGTSAKVDCPKKFIGKKVYIIITK
jgi:putative transposon-encoded protein